MKIGSWAGLMLAASLGAGFLTGCGNFWQDPNKSSSTSFSLSNSGSITVAQGSSGTATITVTPGSSFTGTVKLSCAITTSPSSATSPATCGLSSTSLTFSGTSAQTSTLTAYTTGTTTLGAYDITVTGSSSSVSATTVVCAEVGTGTCNSTAGTSGKFYILNTNSIAGYTASSSSVTAINSYTVSGTALSVAIAPSGNFLYVASTDGITLYTISSTGALTQGNAGLGDGYAQAIQVDPSGKWLLEASAVGSLIAYPITSAGVLDGNRSVQTTSLAAATVSQIAISPNGQYIAVALGSSGTQVFPFTSGNASPIGSYYTFGSGHTSTIQIYNSGGSALSVAMDPNNRFLYIGETDAFPSSTTDSGGLRVYALGTGSLSPLVSTPYASGGVAPHSILPTASGSYVYVANGMGASTAGNITEFGVSATALTLGSTAATGIQPVSLAEDSTGSYVFEVGSTTSSNFDAYTFSSTTGSLTSQVTSTATSSVAVVAVP